VTAVVWFRRDLRIHDNPALRAALDEHDDVVPVFVFDDRILHGPGASGPRTQFLLECLADLRERIPLVIRHGDPVEELPKLGDVVYHAWEPGRRDHKPFPGLGVVDDLVGDKPSKVFTPYYRRWLQQPRREVLQAPRRELKTIRDRGTIPTLRQLGLEDTVTDPMRGGETEGRRRLGDFVRRDYDTETPDKTSRLSPYLHFGCISAREAE
jgi:deoxyribodipyrimidine photo-lyase